MERESGMIVYDAQSYLAPATVKDENGDYRVLIPTTGASLLLQRDVDFGVPNKKFKKPMLYKAGAEKVTMGYGVSSFFETEEAVEEFPRDSTGKITTPFFFYRIRCSLKKLINPETGLYVHITDGFGSANSEESACGTAYRFDLGNTRLKIARKRALVDAALMLGQLSSMFSQDIENEDFMETLEEAVKVVRSEGDKVSRDQVARLYTIAGTVGKTKEEAKKVLKKFGYDSATDILIKDYDKIIEALKARE